MLTLFLIGMVKPLVSPTFLLLTVDQTTRETLIFLSVIRDYSPPPRYSLEGNVKKYTEGWMDGWMDGGKGG